MIVLQATGARERLGPVTGYPIDTYIERDRVDESGKTPAAPQSGFWGGRTPATGQRVCWSGPKLEPKPRAARLKAEGVDKPGKTGTLRDGATR